MEEQHVPRPGGGRHADQPPRRSGRRRGWGRVWGRRGWTLRARAILMSCGPRGSRKGPFCRKGSGLADPLRADSREGGNEIREAE